MGQGLGPDIKRVSARPGDMQEAIEVDFVPLAL